MEKANLQSIKLYGLLIFILAITSCKKDTNETPTPDPIIAVNDTKQVIASIKGVVVNELNMPVQGATVTIGTNSFTTNSYGQFLLSNQSISENNSHIKVVKAGYFNGNRSLMVTSGNTHLVRIKLIPKTTTGTFTATSGGVVALASGGKITFPANAIVDASGAVFNGIVNVAMAYISPTANDLESTVIGDLRGVATNNEERCLETYGMLGAELESTTGQVLKIATGKSAQLNIPLPTSLQANAPASIPLWHFDEVIGRWKEEGTANKVGTEYVGNVSHFSFWNVDVPGGGVQLCVTITNSVGVPFRNTSVRIVRLSSGSISGTGNTDSTGKTCGIVFKNEPLKIDVLDQCGNVVYTQNIGPYAINTSLTITATSISSNTINISGTVVNCSNNPISTGSVSLFTSSGYYYNAPVASNGSFSISILKCSGAAINYSIRAFDNTTNQVGNIQNGSISNSVNVGNIQACGSTNEFINVFVDGISFNWTTPTNIIRMGVSSSTTPGTFSFASAFYCVQSLDANQNADGNAITWDAKYNNAVGSYPLLIPFIYVTSNPAIVYASSSIVITPNPQINITAIGAVGTGYIEGNFNIIMRCSPGNINRTVQCNFKIKRN